MVKLQVTPGELRVTGGVKPVSSPVYSLFRKGTCLEVVKRSGVEWSGVKSRDEDEGKVRSHEHVSGGPSLV